MLPAASILTTARPLFNKGQGMKFKVTKDDVKNGRKMCGNQCPVALSISREIQEPVRVGLCHVSIFGNCEDGDYVSVYNLPSEVSGFIHNFDCGVISVEEFEEFEFELNIGE